MKLKEFMSSNEISDAEMAEQVSDISEGQIRKLKRGERQPSIEVAKRIDRLTNGQVGLHDWDKPPIASHEACDEAA